MKKLEVKSEAWPFESQDVENSHFPDVSVCASLGFTERATVAALWFPCAFISFCIVSC